MVTNVYTIPLHCYIVVGYKQPETIIFFLVQEIQNDFCP